MIAFLANHLWQSTVFAVIAWLLTIALREHHARARYWLWLSASLKFLIPFAALVDVGSHLGWFTANVMPVPRLLSAMNGAAQPFAQPDSDLGSLVPVASNLPAIPTDVLSVILLVIWCSGFAAILFRGCLRWRRISLEARLAAPILAGREFEALLRVQGLRGRQRPIAMAFSFCSMEHAVYGILHPILLLPEGIAGRLSDPQLEAILAHEVCHVRRRDNLAAMSHMLVEAIFWFHPLVWWVGARLIEERERACDEDVLLLGSEPEVYAEGILRACKFYLESPLPCMSGVTGADLKRRVERIMSNSLTRNLNLARKLLLVTTGVAAVGLPIVIGLLHAPVTRAESQASPAAFEVASVKSHKPTPGPFSVSRTAENGRMNYVNVTLKGCILAAYGVQGYQVSGGPAWLASERYDIVAKAAGRATEEQMMPMLRSLLSDRFKLAVHRETKDLPIYALVVDKNGLKIHQVKDDDSGTQTDGDDQHPITARNLSMPQFAEILSRPRQTDRPVFDRTGLKGVFNFALDYSRIDATADRDSPDIFSALQEQLGLRLVPTRGPVELLVIEHVERPTEN